MSGDPHHRSGNSPQRRCGRQNRDGPGRPGLPPESVLGPRLSPTASNIGSGKEWPVVVTHITL